MQLQISGTIQGIEARNGGWVAVAVLEPNNQYPKKLSTKKPDLIQQAQSLMGHSVTALYNEMDGNTINPHTGLLYVNRYLEALSLGQSVAVPQGGGSEYNPGYAAQPQPQPVQPQQVVHVQPQPTATIRDYQRELNINRQSARRDAISMLEWILPEDRTLAGVIRMTEQFVKHAMEGVPWQTEPVAPAPLPTQPDPHLGQDGPQVDDDGIPF